jgi:hypothetical protein
VRRLQKLQIVVAEEEKKIRRSGEGDPYQGMRLGVPQ